MIRRLFQSLLFVLSFASALPAMAATRVDDLVIATADGRNLPFRVEMALDDESRAKGLMFRQSLAPDGGMLFLWGRPVGIVMWMKNTPIPLDMLFVDQAGVIIRIARQTVPYSLDNIPAGAPALGVLEVAGGTADRLGIHAGDRMVHPAFH
ncbi:DUF192 domain-containing protein [Zavarzinia aquatilis]|uniref:DUF192 domain-containing protein n=1 Tax=Zavarzinia aquatilis TaxID=2211142 RepID=A0A317EHM9_9PROT|nr:DUF192 domain-containing protein [Zavarzinia aquatilis]PWR25570.1 DUF192 domain-containing protein [Zavarzinia aquatilis]